MRLARFILVVVTAVAAFGAASLQGKVLCYADGGRHVAIEAPHGDAGCSGDHDRHDDSESSDGPKDEHAEHCSDLTADFSIARESSPRSTEAHPADLTIPHALPPAVFSATLEGALTAPEMSGSPPPPLQLSSLRTIVLLV